MSTPSSKSVAPREASAALALSPVESRQRLIAWSSFLLALLQSVCGAILAISGLRLAIGVGALALSTGAGAAIVRFHADAIRIPMIVAALLGSLLNLAIFVHVRHLRNRPAAQWRRRPQSVREKRMERLQLGLSLATLVLIAIEEYLHFSLHHSF